MCERGDLQKSTPIQVSRQLRPSEQFRLRGVHRRSRRVRRRRRRLRLGYRILSACTNILESSVCHLNMNRGAEKINSRKVIIDARKQPCLSNAQPPSLKHCSQCQNLLPLTLTLVVRTHRSHESSIVVDQTHTRHTNPPPHHNERQEDTWTHLLQEHVRQGFEYTVADEEDCQAHVVLRVGEAEIFLQAVDFGVADVGSIKK